MAPKGRRTSSDDEETSTAEPAEEILSSAEEAPEEPQGEPEPVLKAEAAPAEEAPAAPAGPAGVIPGRILKVGRVTYRVLSILGPNTVRAAVAGTGKIVTLDL